MRTPSPEGSKSSGFRSSKGCHDAKRSHTPGSMMWSLPVWDRLVKRLAHRKVQPCTVGSMVCMSGCTFASDVHEGCYA
eukprot:525077-Pelagomonas_calceolata.AAC.3